MSDTFQPKIMGFLCNWCAYAGADLAGVSRFQYPPAIRPVRVMCTGRVDPVFIVKALEEGYDGVFTAGWHPGECHYQDGNFHAEKRIAVVAALFDLAGIERDRLLLRWVSSAEGKLFADYVNQATEAIARLGPFDPKTHLLSLAAIRQTLQAPRIRWLLGMEKPLVEQQNVYGEKIDPAKYKQLLDGTIGHEYRKALIFEALGESEGQSTRKLAKRTGLDLHLVSSCVVELENCGQAALSGYDGPHPQFIKPAA